ncbi:piggyBac transposable element-derived protein 4-like [Vespula squamosa]|uniref:PiggyBac transposable element-derived protein 4-like n=1 Tax=Vespula squamosa TaxID=30214 RepID=A0ABD2B9Y3_VESSQ
MRCKFTRYIPREPDKFGIKFWLASDTDKKYVINGFSYLRKEESRPLSIPLGEFVVLELVEPFTRCWRHVTMDNFFTSASLATKLLVKRTTLFETIRSNKRLLELAKSAKDELERFSTILSKSMLRNEHQDIADQLFHKLKKLTRISSYIRKSNEIMKNCIIEKFVKSDNFFSDNINQIFNEQFSTAQTNFYGRFLIIALEILKYFHSNFTFDAFEIELIIENSEIGKTFKLAKLTGDPSIARIIATVSVSMPFRLSSFGEKTDRERDQ